MKLSVTWRLLLVPLQAGLAFSVWAQGIPMEQWSPHEQQVVEMARKQYAAQGMALTQEQAEMTIKAMRDQMARMTGMVAGLQAAGRMPMPAMPMAAASSQTALQPPMATTSEAQLAQTLAQWPAKPEVFVIKERRDGFDINGQPVLDAEGKIFSYAVNAVTGAATYAVQGLNSVTIKAVAPAAPYPTVTIASGVQNANGWEMTTATGQRMVGNTLSVLSDGFMVGRSAAAFRYRTGHGMGNLAIPSGYFLAPLQRGDIGSTGFVLLEKEGAAPPANGRGSGNSLADLISATKALGSVIGMTRKEDFALLDMQTGKLFPLNIPADGKAVSVYSECRKRNKLINECNKVQSFESVYGTDGFKNNMHYYWKATWLPTAQGPIALTQEDGVSGIFITDLRTGRKVQAFHRALGIADWDVQQRSDGVVGVKAKMVFEWQDIPDAVAFLQSAPEVGAKPATPAAPDSNAAVQTQ